MTKLINHRNEGEDHGGGDGRPQYKHIADKFTRERTDMVRYTQVRVLNRVKIMLDSVSELDITKMSAGARIKYLATLTKAYETLLNAERLGIKATKETGEKVVESSWAQALLAAEDSEKIKEHLKKFES